MPGRRWNTLAFYAATPTLVRVFPASHAEGDGCEQYLGIFGATR